MTRLTDGFGRKLLGQLILLSRINSRGLALHSQFNSEAKKYNHPGRITIIIGHELTPINGGAGNRSMWQDSILAWMKHSNFLQHPRHQLHEVTGAGTIIELMTDDLSPAGATGTGGTRQAEQKGGVGHTGQCA